MKKRTKIILALIGVVLAIPVFLIAVYIIGSMPGSTKKLEAVGAQFKPDPSWELESKDVRAPQAICIQANCNTLFQQWNTESQISNEKLTEIINRSGWNFDITGSCELRDNVLSKQSVCEANGFANNYSVNVSIYKNPNNISDTSIILKIK